MDMVFAREALAAQARGGEGCDGEAEGDAVCVHARARSSRLRPRRGGGLDSGRQRAQRGWNWVSAC
jgi:hypothetical protein